MKPALCPSLALSALIALLPTAGASAQISFYSVEKAGYYVQDGPTVPVPEPVDAFYITLSMQPSSPDSEFDFASVSKPGGGGVDLLPFLFAFDTYPTRAALDAAFGAGTYTFLATTTDSDVFTAQLVLPSGGWPNIPQVMNFTAAQSINPAQDFTVQWNSFGNGTANDLIRFTVIDNDTVSTVFTSPDYGEVGALDGRAISVVVPAGTLVAGKSYTAYLTFNRLFFDATVANAGLAAYMTETSVPMKAVTGGGTPQAPRIDSVSPTPAGFDFHLTVTPGSTITIQRSTNLGDPGGWGPAASQVAGAAQITMPVTRTAGARAEFFRVTAN